ncbi:MAG: alpha-L-arabinofuranosidase [Isosphaera sp.]|nr:alpha-L-arabinofuranosidase [Isosphaera sp.]
MNHPDSSRRDFLRGASGAALAAALPAGADPAEPVVTVAPDPLFELSPYLYMQFMEPLGATDGSVEASWDHLSARWRPDLVEATKALAPPMLRWGGLFSAYYRWREGVGPRDRRKPMHNLVWGGVESNQVGTLEFLDFCEQVKAEPLMCVNFEAEGYPPWAKNALGEVRAGDAREAADWVRYCNDPKDRDRIAHGRREPAQVKFWQIGNETSYSAERFKKADAVARTLEFAHEMRKADPAVKLIAWGDSGWAADMVKEAGGRVDYLAFHNLFDPGPPCSDREFRKDPDKTWDVLMAAVGRQEKKIVEVRQQAGKFPLALTESHFAMRGRDRCDLNSAWAVGVAYARFQNLHQRHGDVLKIANLGDFCGTRWQTNVVMIPTPGGKAYLMPVGKVAALYRRHTGTHAARVGGAPAGLDVVASRAGDAFFVHVVNTSRTKSQTCRLAVTGVPMKTGKAFEITAGDPFAEVTSAQDDPAALKTRDVDPGKAITFPPASVTAVELRG